MSARAPSRPVPRRRKRSLAARAKPFWVVAILIAAGLGWGASALAGAPWFRLARLSVDLPLRSPVSGDEVRAAAAIAPGTNVWLVPTWAVARRIEALPYVDRATVRRGQFPQPFVELGVTVRRPSACLRGGGRTVTIDVRARVLQAGCALPGGPRIDAGRDALPAPGATVADPDVARLLADAKVLADAELAVRSLGRDRWGGLEAVDVTGVTLRFGADGDLAAKAALVAPVRSTLAKRRLRAIDLRAPATPTVELR